MITLNDLKITDEEIEIIKKLVENHKYDDEKENVLIFRSKNTGRITIENQNISFERGKGMVFKKGRNKELLWWYEKADREPKGKNDKEMAEEITELLRKLTDEEERAINYMIDIQPITKRVRENK